MATSLETAQSKDVLPPDRNPKSTAMAQQPTQSDELNPIKGFAQPRKNVYGIMTFVSGPVTILFWSKSVDDKLQVRTRCFTAYEQLVTRGLYCELFALAPE